METLRCFRMLMNGRILGLLAGCLMCMSRVYAVPPVPGQTWTGGRTCFVNESAAANRIRIARGAPALAPPTKSYSVIVIRVQFPGTPFTTNTAAAFFQKVQDYYKENSFGVFVPTFTLTSVFTLSGPLAQYGSDCGGDVACHDPAFIQEAIQRADASINFNDYDHVMVYHAGYGQESGVKLSNNIWSLFYSGLNIPVDGTFIKGATLVPELEIDADPLGVICHEYGHQLGLPDLYDTSVAGGRSTVGAWDLMDYPWMGIHVQGDNPPHLGAWSKRFLGFGSTQVLASSGTVSLSPIEFAPGKSIQIYSTESEYFLAEYRLRASTSAYDKDLPDPAGLAVWHVDDALLNAPNTFKNNTVNVPSLNGHNGVDLVESDGRAVYPPGGNDLWTNGLTFASPASNLFNGTVSSLVMTGIHGVGGSEVAARILFLGAKNQQSVARAISYPNPATGHVRSDASPGTWSTLRLQLSRPVSPTALKATIYTILGQRVQEIPGANFNFRVDLSRDYEWVYEYDWNGRDETGAEVASGVYYLQFDVDGEKIRKPIVVQR